MGRTSLLCACPCSAVGLTFWHLVYAAAFKSIYFLLPWSCLTIFCHHRWQNLIHSQPGCASNSPAQERDVLPGYHSSLHSQLLNPSWKNLASRQQIDRTEGHPVPPQLSWFLHPRSLVALQSRFNSAKKPPMWMAGECLHFGQSHSLCPGVGGGFVLILLLHSNYWYLRVTFTSHHRRITLVITAEPSLQSQLSEW